MELTSAHLRYLLAIYEISRNQQMVSSRSIAEAMGVTKPSVARILNLLMERGMIVKEHYGKIYLTDRGFFVARRVKAQLENIRAHFPPLDLPLTDEERDAAALAMASALPDRVFSGAYDRLLEPEDLTENKEMSNDQQETAGL